MITDKIVFYNNIYKSLLGTGIILLILSFTFFYTSNLKIYFKTMLNIKKQKETKTKVKEKRKNKRSKNVYETNNFKEINYDESHEIKDPSVELTNMTGVLNDETDELANEGGDTTGSLNLEDDDGKNETVLLSKYVANNKSDKDDVKEEDYFNNIPTDDGTLLFESQGDEETSLLTQNDLTIKKNEINNRLWSNNLKYFDIIKEKDIIVINTKERI